MPRESTQLENVLDAIRVKRPGGIGRPRKRPDRLIADKGFSFPGCRRMLRSIRGIPHLIPERRDQRERRGKRPGRKPSFDKATYARRNVVERCVNKLSSSGGASPRATRSGRSTTGQQ